jgi:putative transposase
MKNRRLNRLRGFDYSNSRNYFVTICIADKIRSFGKIENKIMQLSPEGIIAGEQLEWLVNQYPYIDLISHIIMPDHIHVIIKINPGFYITQHNDPGGNGRDRSLHNTINVDAYKIKPLPELIGAYKTTVSKRIHHSGNIEFKWQKSYHDHIIRNARSLNIIKHYIESNPQRFVL